ncbi:cellulase family glycosylhydrolase [uncultured Fibrobacter sp.]|uniref:cellulase family glycosylhydrolase n=1 Tax=uncultured Fibrobacter sp. TaxID=261512 RepID=UPI0025DDACE7|nr:cellulase family glycosylhydrolase [uncultured Fibrobacter sp.]
MKLKKIIPCVLALTVAPAFSAAVDAVPKKVGPVSYYGAIHTSGGKIIGAKNNQEAMLRGMSLFWSDATGLPYYKKDVISWAVDNLKMDVFRFAMGITCYSSKSQKSNGCIDSADSLFHGYSYATAPESYMATVDKMVEAAIENDVYIIIDWHSHRAEYEKAMAKTFFSAVSKKYANIPNVIYEVYNEPVNTGWGTIQSYANEIIGEIRKNTENLALVGTPNWSQLTNYGGVNGTNVGYVFHFYAGTHKVGSFGSKITQAKSSGSPVFITEWGTVEASGAGNADQGATSDWMNFMEQNKISNCNWSLRQTNGTETSGMFEGSEELSSQGLLEKATYSSSGNLVKSYLTKHAQSWADSLTKGKHTGSCAFAHASAKETDGKVSNVLKSGCTYTSSNEDVVSVSGSDLTIKSAGFSILTGNDGSQSVVTIRGVAGQGIVGFNDMFCRYNDASTHPCSVDRGADYSKTNSSNMTFEWVLGTEKKTIQGATYTITSLNPDIVDVKTAACKNTTYCSSSQKDASSVIMFHFKKIGEAKIVATAPAVTGYRAMNDTITVTYRKGEDKIHSKFGNMKIALGAASAAGTAPEKSLLGSPVKYSFNYDGENFEDTCPYLSVSGTSLAAGTQNAIVLVRATTEGTDVLDVLNKTIRVIVGDSAQAVNLNKMSIPVVKAVASSSIVLQYAKGALTVAAPKSAPAKVTVFNAIGKEVYSKTIGKGFGTLPLSSLSAGNYIATVTQGSQQATIKFTK